MRRRHQHGPRRPRPGDELWLLEPLPEATLLVIDGPDDFDELTSSCPHRHPRSPGRPPLPDWERLARQEVCAGVHMTETAAARRDWWPGHRWEVESTVWFRWSFQGEPMSAGAVAPDWTLRT